MPAQIALKKQENGYILLMCLCKFIGAMCGAISVYEGMEDITSAERKMQPARGRFARSDLDRQMASTFPCPLESGPSSRFFGPTGHWNPQSGWHYSY